MQIRVPASNDPTQGGGVRWHHSEDFFTDNIINQTATRHRYATYIHKITRVDHQTLPQGFIWDGGGGGGGGEGLCPENYPVIHLHCLPRYIA